MDADEGRRRDPDVFAARLEAEHLLADVANTSPAHPDRALADTIAQSRRLARQVACQNGVTPIGITSQTAPALSPSYLEEVRSTKEAQLVLAGRRTASLLVGLR